MAGDKLKMSAFLVQSAAAVSTDKQCFGKWSAPYDADICNTTSPSDSLLVKKERNVAVQTLLTGLIYGWPSTTIVNFKSNNTVLSSQMTLTQVSLLGSVANIGEMLVTPMCGFIINRLGRKYSAMLLGLPFVISWSIISITKSVPLVIAARGFAGIGAAGQAVTSVYIAEICHKSIRGALTSAIVIEYYLGLLLSYVLGGYLMYHQALYIYVSLSVLHIILLSILKESPVFLMQAGKEHAARKSIAFYRCADTTSEEVEIEIAKIKLLLDPRINQILEADNGEISVQEGLIEKLPPVKIETESTWTFLKKSRSSRRALFTVLVVMSLAIFTGPIVFQVYAELLFQEALPTMSANKCSIFLAIDYVVAALLCASVLDMFGRKLILTTTSIACGIFCLLLGTQLHLHWAPHWFTAFCIYGYAFVINLGVIVIPFVLTAEVFLPEIRGFCSSMSMTCMCIMNFVALLIFNPLVDSIGLGLVFCGFSVICFICAIYSQFCLPETKGLTVDAIQLVFLEKKRMRLCSGKRTKL